MSKRFSLGVLLYVVTSLTRHFPLQLWACGGHLQCERQWHLGDLDQVQSGKELFLNLTTFLSFKNYVVSLPTLHYYVLKTLLRHQRNPFHFRFTCYKNGIARKILSTHYTNQVHSTHTHTRTPGAASYPTTQFLKSLASISPKVLRKASTTLPHKHCVAIKTEILQALTAGPQ